MHKNAFGVVHISKRDLKRKEAIGGAAGGAIGAGVSGAAYKPVRNLANRKVHDPMNSNSAEAIMNGGSTAVAEAKKVNSKNKSFRLLREFNGKKSIVSAGIAGAGIGAYAGHKLHGRKTKLR